MAGKGKGMLSRMHGIRRLVAIALIGALGPFAFSCYGAFPLTHIVYKLNGEIKPGVLAQIVFWIFVIFPVYNIAILADAIVFNLVQFWTGATIGEADARSQDGTSYVLKPSADGREAVLTVSKGGKTSVMRFVRLADGRVEVRDAQGHLAGRVVPDGSGGFRLTDANGAALGAVSAADIAALAADRAR